MEPALAAKCPGLYIVVEVAVEEPVGLRLHERTEDVRRRRLVEGAYAPWRHVRDSGIGLLMELSGIGPDPDRTAKLFRP